MQRHGLTLLELSISMGLFAMLFVLLIESVTGIQTYLSTEDASNELVLEADQIFATMMDDLGNAAWFIKPGTDLLRLAADPDYDREDAHYYPYILTQDEDGLPDVSPFYDAHQRYDLTPPQVVDAATMPDNLPPQHREPSRELVFMKVRTGTVAPSPDRVIHHVIDFDAPAVPMADYRNGVEVASLELDSTGQVAVDMPLAWESHLDAPDNTDPEQLREYSYALVPSSDGSRRSLQRLYRNGSDDARPLLDEVLSTHVDRIVFDTYRTAPELKVNQVRVRLFMSQRLESSRMRVSHRAEMVVAMRSTVDPEYALRLADWLGTAGDFTLGGE